MAQFKHVLSIRRAQIPTRETRRSVGIPQRDDNELCILGAIFGVIDDNEHVSQIERGVDLVHKVQWCWLCHRIISEHL